MLCFEMPAKSEKILIFMTNVIDKKLLLDQLIRAHTQLIKNTCLSICLNDNSTITQIVFTQIESKRQNIVLIKTSES